MKAKDEGGRLKDEGTERTQGTKGGEPDGKHPTHPLPEVSRATWCVHVAGPDEVHACESRKDAENKAAAFNTWANKLCAEIGNPNRNPASAKLWPYDSRSHAADLKSQKQGTDR
jgi:hypothetical protein